mmetsp:Transcript_45527/g.110285  ORF Transcript_45527/g.110285 Transcript_45527/m.110285 type:complete len:202 (+) Transcript_45527:1033-1638(+)
MNLSNGRRCQRCAVHIVKRVGNGSQLFLDHALDNGPFHWFRLVQTLLEFQHVLLGKQGWTGGNELSQLDISGAQLFKECSKHLWYRKGWYFSGQTRQGWSGQELLECFSKGTVRLKGSGGTSSWTSINGGLNDVLNQGDCFFLGSVGYALLLPPTTTTTAAACGGGRRRHFQMRRKLWVRRCSDGWHLAIRIGKEGNHTWQ